MLTVPLAHVEAASPRLRLLTLDLARERFPYQAGQAVVVGPHAAAVRRPYSVACSPERALETGTLQLLIAVDDGRSDLPWAVAGALVDVEGPVGTLTLPEPLDHPSVLFVAGGTGIAPVRAMLDHLFRRHPGRRVSLLYSTRRSDEFVFVEELREHARAGRLEFHPTVTRDDSVSWSGRRGRIGRGHFEAVLHDPASTLCVVCGPHSLVTETAAMLGSMGVPPRSIRTEGWTTPTSR